VATVLILVLLLFVGLLLSIFVILCRERQNQQKIKHRTKKNDAIIKARPLPSFDRVYARQGPDHQWVPLTTFKTNKVTKDQIQLVYPRKKSPPRPPHIYENVSRSKKVIPPTAPIQTKPLPTTNRNLTNIQPKPVQTAKPKLQHKNSFLTNIQQTKAKLKPVAQQTPSIKTRGQFVTPRPPHRPAPSLPTINQIKSHQITVQADVEIHTALDNNAPAVLEDDYWPPDVQINTEVDNDVPAVLETECWPFEK